MIATTFLVLSIIWTSASLCAVVRLHRSGPLSLPIMMTGWLVGDHPVAHFAAQFVAAGALIGSGALDATRGMVALGLTIVAWSGLVVAYMVSRRARASAEDALVAGLGPDYRSEITPAKRAEITAHPDRAVMRLDGRFRLTGVDTEFDVPYGEHPKRNLLDIYRPAGGSTGAPVLIQVHGGGWVVGHKQQQGLPLILRLARRGWVCVSINYRLAPKHRFPDQIVDVKRAIAWVKANISEHGGDPSTIVLTGGSAGGHLASLAALTPGRAELQPGFEGADTTVTACIPFYGPVDFADRNRIRGRFTSMEPFLTRLVMPRSLSEDPALWNLVSPISHVNPDAPAFFVIQGHNDVLVWREETREFVDRLREVSRNTIVHWEVPGAQHAFDTFPAHRTTVAVDAVETYLAHLTSRRRNRRAGMDMRNIADRTRPAGAELAEDSDV